jgi:hypothetical protein
VQAVDGLLALGDKGMDKDKDKDKDKRSLLRFAGNKTTVRPAVIPARVMGREAGVMGGARPAVVMAAKPVMYKVCL